MRTFEKELARKGCSTILLVSERGLKPGKTDFTDVLREIEKVVERAENN